ncbi:hypothetical protein AAKU52_002857 [Pedobacter sp. CG_S7]
MKELSPTVLLQHFVPYPDNKMDAYRVSTDINSTVIKGV